MMSSTNATLHSSPLVYTSAMFNNHHVAAATDYGLAPSGFPAEIGTAYAAHVPVVATSGYLDGFDLQHWPPSPGTTPFLNPPPGFNPTFSNIPSFPALAAAPASMGNTHQPTPTCTNCGRTFTRGSDLQRHMKKHQPGPKEYQCTVQGCKYKGSHRKDKLEDHKRCRHPNLVEGL